MFSSDLINEKENDRARNRKHIPRKLHAHLLSQADLPEIASQGVLSEILNEKRSLNLRQIKLLSKRFGVSPSTFIDD